MTISDLDRNLISRVNLADCLRRSATLYPERLALQDGFEAVSFQALHRDANRLARGMLESGVQSGDFVGLIFRNHVDFFRLYFACARIGAIALPLNPHLREHEYQHILAEARPKLMVAQADYAELAVALGAGVGSSVERVIVGRDASGRLPDFLLGSMQQADVRRLADLFADDASDVEVEVDDRDAVQCIYTSGTTASPKGVITSHVAAVFTALTVAHHMRLVADDTGLVLLPIHHVGGLNDSTIPHLVVGASVVLVDGWNAEVVAEALAQHKVTDVLLTAPMWMELLNINADGQHDWSALRTCLCGIATLPPERAEQLRKLCPNADVILASGQTEFTGFQECQTTEHQFTKPMAWGAPSLMTDVQIMDDEGRIVGPQVIGEIVYRGPQAMTEYFAHPELTEDSFKFGWFHSGDLGYVDEDHTVFFVDRKKDMIKTGGENVASIEVAHAVLALPGIADCAVVGLPHPRWTEAITAFVKLEPDTAITEAQVVEHCTERLASFKVPKRVIFVDDFPRTASGKIQKVPLREQWAELYDNRQGSERV
jgi:acyl-CoA synthetase (AMP-forming)/AMP-acid ligase II